MASEEQYLDDLLKNVTQNTSERSMDEVMREMMGESAPMEMPLVQEENIGPALEQPSELDLEAMLEGLDFDAGNSELAETNLLKNDTLADVMDVLEDPSIFTDPSMANNPDAELLSDINEFLINEPESVQNVENIINEEPVFSDVQPEEAPAFEETPIPEEAPVFEETPIPEEAPVFEETPIPEEVPAFEDLFSEAEQIETVSDSMPEDDTKTPVEDLLSESAEEIAPVEEVFPEGIIFEDENSIDDSQEESNSEGTEEADRMSELDELLLSIDGVQADEVQVNESDTVDTTVPELNFDQPSMEDLDALFNELEMEASGQTPPKASSSEKTEDVVSDSVESKTNDIVDKLESTGDSDDDLLALLEGIDENVSSDDYKDIKSELQDENSNEEIDALLGADEDVSSDNKKKKKKEKNKKEKKDKKGGFSLFKKKKPDDSLVPDDAEAPENSEDLSFDNSFGTEELDNSSEALDKSDEANLDQLISEAQASDSDNSENLESLFNIAESMENGELDEELANLPDKSKKEKKPGFFARLFAFLTEEIDDEDEENEPVELSNDDIIAEIDAETAAALLNDKGKKKGKKPKKEKKAKKDDKKAEGSEEGEEGESDAPKKEKKPKKEKAPKEPKEKLPRKVVLSKKASICLVCLCITVVAAIVILSTILPENREKTLARRAYLSGDYETAYENLYGKNLNASDKIILNRSKDILMIQRRWNSYENRIKLNQPAEAIDSLIEGIVLYESVKDKVDSDIHGIIDNTYQRIVLELQSKYGISVDDAKRLYSLDATEYTRILYAIAYGEDYSISENSSGNSLEEQNVNDQNLNNQHTDNLNTDSQNENQSVENQENNENTIPEREDMLPEEEDLL